MPEIVIDYRPRSVFSPFHDRSQRWACIVAHRRCGKTVACIQDLQRDALRCDKPEPRFAYIAPLLRQAKDVSWTYLRGASSPLLPFGAKANESELRVDYPNGGRVRLYGADNPDSLRGIYLDGVVLDEYADMDPSLWSEVIRPALADRQGWAAFIGTPKGQDGFYRIWREALANPNEWLALSLPASKTGILPPEELAAARAAMSEAHYRREFECSFDEAAEDQFISAIDVQAAFDRKGVATGPKVIGVDVARFGSDRTVVLLRDGSVVRQEDVRSWRGLDLMQTAARVGEIISRERPRAVFVDDIGVGGGVTDRLRHLGFDIIAVNAGAKPNDPTRYVNRRAEMWGLMRDWIRENGTLPNDDALLADLTAPTYAYDHANRLKIEGKESMKGRGLPSPDIADALSMTFAQPVAIHMDAKYATRWQEVEPDAPLLETW